MFTNVDMIQLFILQITDVFPFMGFNNPTLSITLIALSSTIIIRLVKDKDEVITNTVETTDGMIIKTLTILVEETIINYRTHIESGVFSTLNTNMFFSNINNVRVYNQHSNVINVVVEKGFSTANIFTIDINVTTDRVVLSCSAPNLIKPLTIGINELKLSDHWSDGKFDNNGYTKEIYKHLHPIMVRMIMQSHNDEKLQTYRNLKPCMYHTGMSIKAI